MDVAAAAIRRGLLTQLPPIMLSLSKWSDLEKLVCGNPFIDFTCNKIALTLLIVFSFPSCILVSELI
jgi:hypothetical protein